MTAWVPSGGTAGPLVGLAEDDGATTDGGGTGGADVTDGDPLTGVGGLTAAELAGPTGVAGALLSWVLAGADGDPDCTAPALLRWVEQPVADATSTAVAAVITLSDVVRLMLHPPASFTS